MKPQVEILFDDYCKIRKSNLELPQFRYLLNLFPALLVCMADGVLDEPEWEGVIKSANVLAEEFIEEGSTREEKEKLAQAFRADLRYLLDNYQKWEKKFLNTLKSEIDENRSDREFITETMYLFANAADGISVEEQTVINSLSDRLGLAH